jgi:4-hydroxymandelate oxidase
MPKRPTRKKNVIQRRAKSAAPAVAEISPRSPRFVPSCLADYQLLAQKCFSRPAWEYIHSGSADENTVRWNVQSLTHLLLKPRIMVNVSNIDTNTTLLAHTLPHPILVAPTSSHLLVHPEAEIATVRGAGAAGAVFIASTLSNVTIEEITAAASGPVWFQLYADDDRGKTKSLIQHAEAAGCQALCITVDLPWIYARNREAHVRHEVPQLPYPNIRFTGGPASTGQKTWGYRNVSWSDLEWIRGFCKFPLVLKGVLNPDDADLAVKHGAAAIIVSNHGGRGLDTVPASIDALPAVTEKIAGRIPVLMDGGIRRGTDVLKAIARGASAVLLGRPILYGLGVAGSAGVQDVIEILRAEFEAAMALTGRTSVKAIDASLLW